MRSGKYVAGRTRTRAALGAALALALAFAAPAPALASPALGTWSATGTGLGAQTGVSCPSFGLCVSVAGTNANVSTSPTTVNSWQPQAISGLPGALQAVSCAPGTSFCVAVGLAGGVAVNTTTGSGTWTASTLDAGHDLTSVSCPTTSFCFAVDSVGGAIYSTTEGASWLAATPGHTLTAVSCGSSGQCAGIDATHIYASTSPTTAASFTQVAPTDGNALPLKGIACAANNTCVAVDGSGYAWASGNANAVTQTWSGTPIAPALSAVACTPDGVCVATGATSAYASDNPAASEPTWTSSTTGTTPTAIGCTDQGLCAVVDGAANAYVATLPAPTAVTGAGTATSQTAATLAATVNPGDATLTNCYFEYGLTTSYGSSVPCSSTPSSTGGSQGVSAAISGLAGSTAYHFQVVVTNAIGSSGGGDQTFTTQAPIKPSPGITGTPAVGNTLTCGLGATLPAGAAASYSWVRDTTTITGASGGTYIVVAIDQTHHLYCTATISGDGGSASGSSSYVTVPSETLGTVFETVIGAARTAARSVSVPVTCSPQAASACVVKLSLSEGTGHHTVALGSKTAKIAPGAKATVTVSLNARGRSLLAAKHHLKTSLTVTGTVVGAIKGTLKHQTISFTTAHHALRH